MVAHRSSRRLLPALARVLWTVSGLWVVCATGFSGTWTPLVHNSPAAVNLLLLLPDGSVMASQNGGAGIGSGWYRLTPDIQGSYVNGTWTTLASMHDTRLYYPSQVLMDGRVFVAGGEYGTGGPRAEVYDPLTNVWTQTNPPASLWNQSNDDFYDCNSEILPDGRVLLMPVYPHTSAIPLIYNPAANTWSNAGQLFRGTYQDEATWVKLPDDSILTIDPFGTFSERYIPVSNVWVDDGIVPVPIYDPFGFELGGAVLLPNGKAFFLGATGHTALYTPTGTVSPGVWTAGPDIPAGKATPDAPAAMMVTGVVLCAVSPKPTSSNHFPTPTTFYEYDPVANSFASVGAPVGASDNIPCYEAIMLDLPDGNVLYSHMGTGLYVYQPSGSPLAAGKPVISSITQNVDGSYHLIGTGLNGISEGATYGDDFQMNSNYPLVRLTSGTNVYYARTYNWSSTGVMTGGQVVTTEFRLPPGLPAGPYSLVAVANGIASDPFSFSNPSSGIAYCFGDGLDPQVSTLCPCGNFGAAGHGCSNSVNSSGAVVSAAGSTSPDAVVITSSGELPSALSIFLQGDASTPSGVVFGAGVRCVNGNLLRLFSHNAVGGTVSAPQGADLPVSARSAALGDPLSSGITRTYTVYYRDPSPTFCPGATFNVGNGFMITW